MKDNWPNLDNNNRALLYALCKQYIDMDNKLLSEAACEVIRLLSIRVGELEEKIKILDMDK